MIYELRTYRLHPGSQPDYLRAAPIGRAIRGDRYGTLVAYFTTLLGTHDQIYNLWSHPDHAERARRREALADDHEWRRGFLDLITPLIAEQENRLLAAVAPIQPPPDRGNVYELVFTRVRVGRVGEWIALLTQTIDAGGCDVPLGVWQTEVGPLNEVIAMWAHPGLLAFDQRRQEREEIDAWRAFQRLAAPLVCAARSELLRPLELSPWG